MNVEFTVLLAVRKKILMHVTMFFNTTLNFKRHDPVVMT